MKKTLAMTTCLLLLCALFSCEQEITPVVEEPPEMKTVTVLVSEGEKVEYEVEKGSLWKFPEYPEKEDGHYPVLAIDEWGQMIPLEVPIKIDTNRSFEVKWTDWRYVITPGQGRLYKDKKYPDGTDTEIYLPYMVDGSRVTSLGNALVGTPITEVHIPSWIKTLEMSFRRCELLKDLYVPATVEKCVNAPFAGLQSIILEDANVVSNWNYDWQFGFTGNITARGKNIITKDGFVYEIIKNGEKNALRVVTRAERNPAETSITIPDQVMDMDVVSIGKHALACNDELESVTIPEGVTTIEEGAFYDNENLATVTLPSTLKRIESKAFGKLKKMSKITIPASATYCEDEAFIYWGSDKTIELESSFTDLNWDIYWYDGWDGCQAKRTYLDRQTEGVWEYVLYINESGQQRAMLTKDNSELAEVELPSQVGSHDVEMLGMNMYVDNSTITSIKFPSTLKVLAPSCFDTCENLTTLELNEGLERIGKKSLHALGNSEHKPDITIPSSLKFVDKEAFYGSHGQIIIPDGNMTSNWHPEWAAQNDCSITYGNQFEQDGVYYAPTKKANGEDALMIVGGTPELASININGKIQGKDVISVETDAFRLHKNIKNVVLPDTVELINSRAFWESTIETVVVGSGLKTIADQAFAFAGQLKSITIPEGLKSMGSMIFIQTALESIVLPDSLETMDDYCFSGCKQLESVTIGSGLGTLESYTFENCSKLDNVTIPSNIKLIKKQAFKGCSSLKNLTIEEGLETTEANALIQTGVTSIKLPDSLVNIGEAILSGSNNLATVTLPSTMTEIVPDMFNSCKNMETINWPANLKNIRRNAFNSVEFKKGTVLTIPASVELIEATAFGDSKLETLVFEGKIKNIYADAFLNWNDTQQIIFKDLESAEFLRKNIDQSVKIYYQDEKGEKTLIEKKAD